MLLSHMRPSFSAVRVSLFSILVKLHCLEKPVGNNIHEYEKWGKHFFGKNSCTSETK